LRRHRSSASPEKSTKIVASYFGEYGSNAPAGLLRAVLPHGVRRQDQFTSFVLAARYGSPVLVFLGIMLGSVLITGNGVVIGKGLVKVVPERYLRYIAAGLFIVFGLIFLAGALLGVEIF